MAAFFRSASSGGRAAFSEQRRSVSLGLALGALGLAVSGLTAVPAMAQDYPSRDIRVVVPFPAGGAYDVVARIIMDSVSKSLSRSVIVENKAGAGALIGIRDVLRAEPDGYTVLVASAAVVSTPLLDEKAGYELSEFTAVSMAGGAPNVFVGSPTLPIETMEGLIEYVRQNPGKLNVGTAEPGGSNFMTLKSFTNHMDLDVAMVYYKGTPPMVPDLLNGSLAFTVMAAGLAVEAIGSGQLKGLAVSDSERLANLPDLPAITELGFPEEFVVLPFLGFVVRSETPAEIVELLNAEITKALQDPAVVEKLNGMSFNIATRSVQESNDYMVGQQELWDKLIAERY